MSSTRRIKFDVWIQIMKNEMINFKILKFVDISIFEICNLFADYHVNTAWWISSMQINPCCCARHPFCLLRKYLHRVLCFKVIQHEFHFLIWDIRPFSFWPIIEELLFLFSLLSVAWLIKSKKFSVFVSIHTSSFFWGRYLIASHTTDYQYPMIFFNTLAVFILVVAKFPHMHKVRIFGINADQWTKISTK